MTGVPGLMPLAYVLDEKTPWLLFVRDDSTYIAAYAAEGVNLQLSWDWQDEV